MGTSSSYPGPVGHNPLLPPWADDLLPDIGDGDGPDAPDQPAPPSDAAPTVDPALAPPATRLPTPQVSWSGPKNALTRLTNGGSGSLGSTFRSYVRARGGSRAAARTSRAGRATTGELGGFLAGVVRDGVVRAARDLGLRDLVGRDVQAVLASFVDLLAPAGALLEEAIARKAMVETLAELFERYEVMERGIEALDSLDVDAMREMITLSVTNYVNERFQQELVNCVERGSISERGANDLLAEAKDFIAGVVRLEFEGVDLLALDWRGFEGRRHVERIYQDAYFLLGDAS